MNEVFCYASNSFRGQRRSALYKVSMFYLGHLLPAKAPVYELTDKSEQGCQWNMEHVAIEQSVLPAENLLLCLVTNCDCFGRQ